jgi:hypothetical protein
LKANALAGDIGQEGGDGDDDLYAGAGFGAIEQVGSVLR